MPLITKSQAKLMGLPNPSLQTIEMPKDTFSLAEAREWLRAHGYLWQNHRSTAHFRRFIQAYDVRGAEFRSKKLPNGAVLVWQRW